MQYAHTLPVVESSSRVKEEAAVAYSNNSPATSLKHATAIGNPLTCGRTWPGPARDLLVGVGSRSSSEQSVCKLYGNTYTALTPAPYTIIQVSKGIMN